MTGFSCAVSESTFNELRESDEISVLDYHGMGSMSEFDYCVSIGFSGVAESELSALSEQWRTNPEQVHPQDPNAMERLGERYADELETLIHD